MRASNKFLPLAAALAVAACAGDAAPSGDEAATMAADSMIKPMVREPLTDADLNGIAVADLSMELPWTDNRVSRDPEPDAGPVSLLSVETPATTGFARALFTFSEATPFPGYEVDILDAGASIPCGDVETPLSVTGERALVIRVHPASAHGGGRASVPVRTRALSPDLFTEGGLVCDEADNVVWVAGLDGRVQLRVLELRNPRRLAVDIR